MNFISVCKNVIQSNNKRGWVDPEPAIRVSKTTSGKAITRAFTVNILDRYGNIVGQIKTSKDGKPLLKCGAKVAIMTAFDVEVVE